MKLFRPFLPLLFSIFILNTTTLTAALPFDSGRRPIPREHPRLLGRVFPNPAIMSNICFTVLVENCRRRHRVQLDQGEDLITRRVPIADLPRLVAAGRIRHSLVVAALHYFDLWRRGIAPEDEPLRGS